MKERRTNIGLAAIVGFGVVGTATAAALSRAGVRIAYVDPDKGFKDESPLTLPWVFVCVPTPYRADLPGSGCDLDTIVLVAERLSAIVDEALERERLQGGQRARTAIVIRSTVPPGTTDRMQKRYPGFDWVHWPEFLTESTAVRDGLYPRRVVVGYTDRSIEAAAALVDLGRGAPFVELVPAAEAEMVKYFSNAFYATAVSFANQLYELCEARGIDYEVVRRCAEHDPMMARYHLDVHHKGFRGYGGKCLPKDAKTLLAWARLHNADLGVLRSADEYNDQLTAANRGRKL